jgi:hypothetical protein
MNGEEKNSWWRVVVCTKRGAAIVPRWWNQPTNSLKRGRLTTNVPAVNRV